MRIALGVEYRGGAYQGWERQRNGPTVQATLEPALERIADHPVKTVCAGRTDSAVHAWGQVVHLDVQVDRPPRAWVLGTNTHLPADISVAWMRHVPSDFSARFSAERRRYRYVIFNRSAPPAVLAGLVTVVHRPLDAARMARAAQALLGEHDFSAFRAQGCQARSPVRRIVTCDVGRDRDCVFIDVEANAFLQHMVRNIAGVLIAIGNGDRPSGWAGEVLAGRSRAAGGVTAPPHGLYLMAVRYPGRYRLPVVCAPVGLW